ncbi:hypothetical protein LPICM02_310083 [Pseudolactococcus piscium]|nr:hypothetical protein LPICM02_310083 [Lactococcus piscium]
MYQKQSITSPGMVWIVPKLAYRESVCVKAIGLPRFFFKNNYIIKLYFKSQKRSRNRN